MTNTPRRSWDDRRHSNRATIAEAAYLILVTLFITLFPRPNKTQKNLARVFGKRRLLLRFSEKPRLWRDAGGAVRGLRKQQRWAVARSRPRTSTRPPQRPSSEAMFPRLNWWSSTDSLFNSTIQTTAVKLHLKKIIVYDMHYEETR